MIRRLVTAAAVFCLTASTVLSQVPAGGELQVNSYTTLRQSLPSVASDPLGGVVVTWESLGPDGSGLGVFGQRYDSAGTRRGGEFQVNSFATGDQSRPAVASNGRGGFVVVWQSASQDGSQGGIFGQRFDAAGAPIGFEFAVNTTTVADQSDPSVASDLAGNFVVTWTSDAQDGDLKGVFGRRFATSGAPIGAEFGVNTYTTRDQSESAVAADASGRFTVAWTSDEQDGSFAGVFARRFDALGAPLGPEFLVNTTTDFWQYRPAIASDAAGSFVVAWAFRDYVGGPGPIQFPGRIMARRYASSGAPQGPQFQVSPSTLNLSPQWAPAVSADAAGNFVVAWDGSPYSLPPGPSPVTGQRYDASGAPRGPAFPVNTSPADNTSKNVSIAADGAGNFVVAWDNPQDGSGEGVIARRFGGIVPAALDVDTAATGGSDGNGIVEPGESVDVRPSWRNVNGAAQTFDATVLGFGGPPASGVTYQLVDGTGAYGTVPNGATVGCVDCYQAAVGFTGGRPAVHWDATLTERLTPDVLGQTKPWALHVGDSFVDVPRASGFYPFVETLLHEGLTAGCASGLYCPGSATTREQMAAFVLLGKEGAGYAPAPCAAPNLFADVPESSIFCDVIEELARRGVAAGCGSGNYCPTAPVTREEMAVFVLRTLDPALSPPACTTPIFNDVPASSGFCRWIEELARRGVVTGCGGGNYCPLAAVTREQMAVFVSVTFGLGLYGP